MASQLYTQRSDFPELVKEEDITITLGDHDRNRAEYGEQTFHIRKGGIIIHPKFSLDERLENDIALLHLDNDAKITENVNTVSKYY